MFTSIILAGCALLGQAAETDGADLDLQVRRLVRQLDAPQLAAREEAEKKLIEMGAEILELLPTVTERTSAETKLRLGRIRHKLQSAAAEASVVGSTVTLKSDTMRLSQALAEIEKQTGNKIEDLRERFGHPKSDPVVSVDFDKTPFFEALDNVLDQAELTVYPFDQSGAIGVVARSESQLPRQGKAFYKGPFRFEAASITSTRDLREKNGAATRLGVEISWEPRLKPIGIKQRLDDLSAVDENGGSLSIDGEGAELEAAPAQGASATRLMLPLASPPREVKQIGELKGKIVASIPGKVEKFRFTGLVGAKNVEKRLAGATVVLEQVRKNNQIWEVRIRVGFDTPGDSLQSHRGWIFNNAAYMEAPDGTKIEHDGMQTTHQTEEGIGIAYMFVLEDAPEKNAFVYETPGVIATGEFEYELKDIELP